MLGLEFHQVQELGMILAGMLAAYLAALPAEGWEADVGQQGPAQP